MKNLYLNKILNEILQCLQRCPRLNITIYGRKRTSLFGTDSHKNHTIKISMFLHEKENNVNILIPSNITKTSINHINQNNLKQRAS